jgi:hypothetical protein
VSFLVDAAPELNRGFSHATATWTHVGPETKKGIDMHKLFFLSALLGSATLAGCSAAPLAVPSDLAETTEQLRLTGMGGWQDGRMQIGASAGRFSRRATQTRLFDSLVRNAGGGRFDIAGPEVGGSAAGRCGFEEREIDLGVVVVPNGRLTYRCDFRRDGHPLAGSLFLAEVPNGSGALAGRTRAGEIQLNGVRIAIRPVHHMAGGGLPAGSPVGYAFDIGDRQIGAVDLNGTSKTIYAPRRPGPKRDAVLMASLALAVLWDPGS